jgi:hypothetical protein
MFVPVALGAHDEQVAQQAQRVAPSLARAHDVLDAVAEQTSPTRSLLRTAARASTAASSVASSLLKRPCVPKRSEPDRSTTSITVSSRSSSYWRTNGRRMRAVTFQSMARTSSPGWYSRTSANSIPCPLNTERYSPAKAELTRPRVRSSMSRTWRSTSAGTMLAPAASARTWCASAACAAPAAKRVRDAPSDAARGAAPPLVAAGVHARRRARAVGRRVGHRPPRRSPAWAPSDRARKITGSPRAPARAPPRRRS